MGQSVNYSDHRVQVIVSDGRLVAQVACPHETSDWTDIPFGARPNCRQPYTEDGEPDMTEMALRYTAKECQVAFYVSEEMITMPSEGTVLGDLPFDYCWDEDGIEIDALAPTQEQ